MENLPFWLGNGYAKESTHRPEWKHMRLELQTRNAGQGELDVGNRRTRSLRRNEEGGLATEVDHRSYDATVTCKSHRDGEHRCHPCLSDIAGHTEPTQ